MADRKRISVIMPVYNGEKFVRQSIRSVLCQTYPRFEILVIDDDSTDRGPEICEEMAAADSRIRFFRRKKQGVSAARNYGLDMATGDLVFFMDSDDLIHPLLFEEMVCRMEETQAGFAFCFYEEGDSGRIEEIFGRVSREDGRPAWKTEEHAGAEERFHTNDRGVVTRIGGKMMERGLTGDLRFDETLINGEDTLFLYRLLCRRFCWVFTEAKWYYYRRHADNVSRCGTTLRGPGYLNYMKKIRDREYEKGRFRFARGWEGRIVYKMEKSYLEAKRAGDAESCSRLRKAAETEKKHPLYRGLPWPDRLLFTGCFHCLFLFHVQRRIFYLGRLCRNQCLNFIRSRMVQGKKP